MQFRLGSYTTVSLKVSRILDYGSLSAGSQVVKELTSMTYSHPSHRGLVTWGYFFSLDPKAVHSPALALTDGMEPGQCWAFHGNSRQLGLQLTQAIQVSALTVGHANTSSTISAPKQIALWGLKPLDSDLCGTSGDYVTPTPDFGSGYCGTHLLSGLYEPSWSSIYQNFTNSLQPTQYFDRLIFEVLENWGNPAFTCIYCIQIYGNSY